MQLVTELTLLDMRVEDFPPPDLLAALRQLSEAAVFGDGKDVEPVFWVRAGAGRGATPKPPPANNLNIIMEAENEAGIGMGPDKDCNKGGGK